MQNVVTYQDDRNNQIDICPECETRLVESGTWPRNDAGQEYATVSHGLHVGTCDLCDAVDAATNKADATACRN